MSDDKPKRKKTVAVSMTHEVYTMLKEIQETYNPKVTARGLVTNLIQREHAKRVEAR